ncbi:endonuclease/exonuclease/phosphatase family protein [Georgenia halophila]|uniref:Endonuclease/exonuclease/phosphatase family protein n=1 Tax=Georgenia halophila TaxID=620889 RepID=A0ABP8LPB4_9MICO
MADTVRMVTLNVLARSHADGPAREPVLRRALRELRPDVVALQEVTRDGAVDQAVDLLGEEYTFVDHPGFSPDGVGACLGSRWPMSHLGTHRFQDAEDLSWAGAVAVEVDAPAVGPMLVVHHKPSWRLDREDLRERQAVVVARLVEELVADRPGLPVVLLGDLDADPEDASIRFLTGRQSLDGTGVRYEDAWEAVRAGDAGHTLSPRNPLVRAGEVPLERGRRIDHIMIRSGPHGPLLDVAACRLVLDRPTGGVWASDHFGVVADLRRPAHPPGTWA